MSKDIKVTCYTFVFQTFLLEHRCACANGCENKLSSTSMSGTSSSSSKFPVRHVYMKLYQLYLRNMQRMLIKDLSRVRQIDLAKKALLALWFQAWGPVLPVRSLF